MSDRKAYDKTYREKNKDKIKKRDKEYRKDYYEKNKGYYKEYMKEWRENNKDKTKEHQKKYLKDPINIKTQRILNWKGRGLICDDIDKLYDHYIKSTNCELCNVDFINDKGLKQRCMDHDHETGLFRNVVCKLCNITLPKQKRKK